MFIKGEGSSCHQDWLIGVGLFILAIGCGPERKKHEGLLGACTKTLANDVTSCTESSYRGKDKKDPGDELKANYGNDCIAKDGHWSESGLCEASSYGLCLITTNATDVITIVEKVILSGSGATSDVAKGQCNADIGTYVAP